MSMNSAQNSDSKQYTESKLGRVHKVHTQRTQLSRAHNAVSWNTGRRVVGRVATCIGRVARARDAVVVAPRSRYKKIVSRLNPYRERGLAVSQPLYAV